jgi:hypothetical protein
MQLQQHTPAAGHEADQSRNPSTPATPSAPIPLDPNQLRQVSGGDGDGPHGGW